MTVAEKEPIFADKLTNTDVSSLEVDSKKADDDLVEPTSAETKAILRKLDRRLIPLIYLISLCSFLGRFDVKDKMTMPTSYFDKSVSLVISLIAYVTVVRDTFQFDTEENGTFHLAPNGNGHKGKYDDTYGNIKFFTWKSGIALCIEFNGDKFVFRLYFLLQSMVPQLFEVVVTIGIEKFVSSTCLCGHHWIFKITFLPALLLAALFYFVLPDWLKNFKFLTERERTILHQMRADARTGAEDPVIAWKPFGINISDSNLTMGLMIIIMIVGLSFIVLNAWPIPLTAPIYALSCYHFGEMMLHFRRIDSIKGHENTVAIDNLCIMQFDDLRSLRGEQWIFIIAYVPTLLLALLSYFALPNLPSNFKFLTIRERAILHRLRADVRIVEEPLVAWKPFGVDIPDSSLYAHSMVYICSTTLSYNKALGSIIISMIVRLSFIHLKSWTMPLIAPIYALACFQSGEMIPDLRKNGSINVHENTV
ncbi:hypothetical protein INT43_007582 [Umbelopsis isabellina]|uniref:Uncharacterized protein n=1 Tax=Mortierella isabellina TaxID=91625 RepID=A0A8H7PMW9_MORIS|nr:hypothetical protein INT43_007582 [Umbelopsis isabellina]